MIMTSNHGLLLFTTMSMVTESLSLSWVLLKRMVKVTQRCSERLRNLLFSSQTCNLMTATPSFTLAPLTSGYSVSLEKPRLPGSSPKSHRLKIAPTTISRVSSRIRFHHMTLTPNGVREPSKETNASITTF